MKKAMKVMFSPFTAYRLFNWRRSLGLNMKIRMGAVQDCERMHARHSL